MMSDGSWISPEEMRAAISVGTGAGVKVAIIDSGVELAHPALSSMKFADDLVVTEDGVRLIVREGRGRDIYGHGTAVAGVLHSVAPEAEIGSFRALDEKNRSRSHLIAECARLAIERGYQVINCSFGCRGLPRYLMDYKEWVDAAYLAGANVVAAASNVSDDTREWPAYFPSVLSVAANDGPELGWETRPDCMISLAAKGERITVPWMDGETRVQTGSSFAAPRIAGLVARLRSVYPDLPADAVKPLFLACNRAPN